MGRTTVERGSLPVWARRRATLALVVAMLSALGSAPAQAAVMPTIVSVDAGYAHTCALTSHGAPLCWGYGLHGALGTGSATSRLLPTAVVGLAYRVRAIDTGSFFTCALTDAGGVACWGWNRSGQLGNGTTIERSTAGEVSGLGAGITAIATGGAHACALTSPGGVKCWGDNRAGQLGDGTTTQRRTPVDVAGLTTRVVAIAAGGAHTCAVLGDASIRCWGANENGQLGTGTAVGSRVPVEVVGLTGNLRDVSAGAQHTCATSTAGDMWCWGWNRFGQLGTGTTESSPFAIGVRGLGSGVGSMSASQYHSCALVPGGGRCWGANKGSGQVGSGTTSDHLSPAAVAGLSGATAISAGGMHSCALMPAGVLCWGANIYGELGNGTRKASRVPVAVDFATHQAVVLTASTQGGQIPSRTAITFRARVTPVAASASMPTVRFEVYRGDGAVWRLAARRDVLADGSGVATLRWTFATTGERSVRALALPNAIYAASGWSARVVYSVTDGSP